MSTNVQRKRNPRTCARSPSIPCLRSPISYNDCYVPRHYISVRIHVCMYARIPTCTHVYKPHKHNNGLQQLQTNFCWCVRWWRRRAWWWSLARPVAAAAIVFLTKPPVSSSSGLCRRPPPPSPGLVLQAHARVASYSDTRRMRRWVEK